MTVELPVHDGMVMTKFPVPPDVDVILEFNIKYCCTNERFGTECGETAKQVEQRAGGEIIDYTV